MISSLLYFMNVQVENFLPKLNGSFVSIYLPITTPSNDSKDATLESKTQLKSTLHSTEKAPIRKFTSPAGVRFEIIFNNKVEVQEYFGKRENASLFSLLRQTKNLRLVSSELGHGYIYDDVPKSKPIPLKEIFRPTISMKEKIVFLYVFQVFIDLCRQHNITYFIYGGTLIGSYRHHGFIPWDDDVDVFVNSRQKQLFQDTVSKKYPRFTASSNTAFQWKFYHNVLSVYRRSKVKWPYIDIFFYDTNGTHIYDVTYGNKRSPIFEKEVIFPLQKRPFEGALLESPHKTDTLLNQMYNISNCKTNGYSHKYERLSKWTKYVRCTELYKYFPFVMRESSVTVQETLINNGNIVNTFHTKTIKK